MKKTNFLLPLLLVGLLTACGGETTDTGVNSEGNSQNTTTSQTTNDNTDNKDTVTDPTVANATLVGKFDLSGITGSWDEGTSKIEDGKDIVSEFTNSVKSGAIGFKSIIATKAERAQLGQGPKVGGIKFNNDASLKFTVEDNKNIDVIVLRFRSWIGKYDAQFKVTVNTDGEFVKPRNDTEPIDIEYTKENATEFTVSTPNMGKNESGHDTKNRPTLIGVYCFNK